VRDWDLALRNVAGPVFFALLGAGVIAGDPDTPIPAVLGMWMIALAMGRLAYLLANALLAKTRRPNGDTT
jgi:hypothetical protein